MIPLSALSLPQAAEYHLKQEHASFKRLKRALGKQVVG